MNRSESKYFNTARRMDKALLDLLERKDLEYITVQEICRTAGVNRSTFYLHYETIGDLLTECAQQMNRQFLDYMTENSSDFVSRLRTCPQEELYLITPRYLLPYLNYVADNRRLFATALRHADTLELDASYRALFRHVLEPILERYRVPPPQRPYMMAFYLKGIMAVITTWLEQDCQDPPDQILTLLQACIPRPSA